MKVAVVTGYVEIPGHPRSREAYDRLGRLFDDLRAAPVQLFRCAVEDCWLFEHVHGDGAVGVRHATADNPTKNSRAYHVVQHQKTEWLAAAATADPSFDVLVWMDYGIAHQPGVTAEVVDAFLRRVRADATITIPGAWPWARGIVEQPDWRFLGSSLVVARELAEAFHETVRSVTLERLSRDRFVTWEVNDWAEVECRAVLPIRWYQADHNASQFTSYPRPPA
jgi:hypothetical protein